MIPQSELLNLNDLSNQAYTFQTTILHYIYLLPIQHI